MIVESILFIFIFILSILILAKIRGILSAFHHKNHTYMDLIFILLYFLEQFLFLILYYGDINHRNLWVGLIILSVTTTASLDKLMMYSRHKNLQGIINSNLIEKKDLFNTIDNQSKELEYMGEQIEIMDKIISDLE